MLKNILIIILILIIFFVAVMIIDCHTFVVRKYSVHTDKSGIKKTKIALLSDLHSTSFGKNNARLITEVKKLNPDAIMISGDMYTAVKGEDGLKALPIFEQLSKKYPIYYANGNHELKASLKTDEFGSLYEDFKNKLTGLGVHYLVNESISLSDNPGIKIYGLNVPFDYYKKFKNMDLKKETLEEMLGEVNESEFSILLSHNPEYFESCAEWGADLVLSGHYHGGLMRLPILKGVISPRFKLFPKYSYGEYLSNNGRTKMILSCGLGTHTLPIRIFNPGEISVIEIS